MPIEFALDMCVDLFAEIKIHPVLSQVEDQLIELILM